MNYDLKEPLLVMSHDVCSNIELNRDNHDNVNLEKHGCHAESSSCDSVCQLDSSVKPYFTSRMLHVAMISNFSTSYNVVNVGYVMEILAENPQAQLTPEVESICASSLIVGMIIGQLLGGVLGDYTTRTKALTLVMTIQIISSIGSALAFSTTHITVFDMLIFWRFLLGIGCGGVYPLAATITSEIAATEEIRSKLVALTFSTQGLAFLLVPLLTWFLITISNDNPMIWRVILGLGCTPGIIVLTYLYCCCFERYKRCCCHFGSYEEVIRVSDGIVEDAHTFSGQVTTAAEDEVTGTPLDLPTTGSTTLLSTDEDEQNAETSNSENENIAFDTLTTPTGLLASIQQESNLFRKLCGTALCWFVFDVMFYGNTLFTPIVLKQAFGPKESVSDTAIDSAILALMALPGYYISVFTIGKLQTPKYVQLQGFTLMGILFGLIGVFFSPISQNKVALLVLYGLTFFFANYGPNTTTFMIPSLTYSPQCRSTLNGISAACGKIGALLGAVLFEPAAEVLGDGGVMIICASLSVVGLILTLSCVSTTDSSQRRRDTKIHKRNTNANGENVNASHEFELL